MNLYLEDKTPVTLTPRDFKGQGGEGAVYIKGGTAFKVYSDPARVVPLAKLKELVVLSEPAIIRPQHPLLDGNGALVGYTMAAVEKAVPLCMAFNKAFRDRYGLTPERALVAVRQLQALVEHIHSCGLLVVDLNEMNFLLAEDLSQVYAIDVDSYQTPSFPATAIMDSIRDRHSKTFSQGTDWFSFAIVSFQLFIGIHPYKGKHPALKTLDARMLGNISVFCPEVSLPAVCQPLDTLPESYRDWYRAVLNRGDRVPPPRDVVLSITLTGAGGTTSLSQSDRLEWRCLARYEGAILDSVGDAVLTTHAVYYQGRKLWTLPANGVPFLVVGEKGAVLVAWREGRRLRLWDARQQRELPFQGIVDDLASTDGRLYARQGDRLLEVALLETPGGVFAQARVIGQALEQATQLFPGVAFQNLLGAAYVSLLPETGVCHQVRLPELDGSRLVQASFSGGVLAALVERRGCYRQWLFRFARNYRTYDCLPPADTDRVDLDLLTLPTGVCLHLTESDEETALRVFSSQPGATGELTLPDPHLTGGRLFRKGPEARLAVGETLYALALK